MGKITRRQFLQMSGLAALGSLAGGLTLPGSPVEHAAMPALPNILIVVFDALSACNMSLYGYPRRTTPEIDQAAGSATVYHRHYAAGNFTSPGAASILTGVYPWTHRAINTGANAAPFFRDHNLFSLLQPVYRCFVYSHNTYVNRLFDQFQESIADWTPLSDLCLAALEPADRFQHAYTAVQAASGLLFWRPQYPSAAYFSTRFVRLYQQLLQEHLDTTWKKKFPRGVPNFTTTFFTLEDALDWLLEHVTSQRQPYCGYVHLMPPHAPYLTRAEFIDCFLDDWRAPEKPIHPLSSAYPQSTLNGQRRLYDEFIAYADAEFGRFYRKLSLSGVLDNTLLILTSDHGEMFERGILAHDTDTLYEPIIRVPMLVWQPGIFERQDIYAPTSAVDLAPTLLKLAGLPFPEWLEGEPLPGIGGWQARTGRNLFVVEAKKNSRFGPLHRATVALVHDEFKLLHYIGHDLPDELYDTLQDPEEQNELSAMKPAMVSDLSQILQEALNQAHPPDID